MNQKDINDLHGLEDDEFKMFFFRKPKTNEPGERGANSNAQNNGKGSAGTGGRGRRANSELADRYPLIYRSVDHHGKPKSNIFRHHLDGGNVARRLLKDAHRRRNILANQLQSGVPNGNGLLRETQQFDRFFIFSDLPEISRRIELLDAECKKYASDPIPPSGEAGPHVDGIRADSIFEEGFTFWQDPISGAMYFDHVRFRSDIKIEFRPRSDISDGPSRGHAYQRYSK